MSTQLLYIPPCQKYYAASPTLLHSPGIDEMFCFFVSALPKTTKAHGCSTLGSHNALLMLGNTFKLKLIGNVTITPSAFCSFGPDRQIFYGILSLIIPQSSELTY